MNSSTNMAMIMAWTFLFMLAIMLRTWSVLGVISW